MLWHKAIGAGGTGGGGADVSFVASRSEGEEDRNYTFNNVPIGDPAPDRHVVVFACGYTGQAFRSGIVNNVQIAGTTRTSLVTRQQPFMVGLHDIPVSSGTAQDIEVSFSRDAEGCAILVWVYYGSFSVLDTDAAGSAGSGSTTNFSLNVADGGFAISGSLANSSSIWQALTEDADLNYQGSLFASGASALTTSGTLNESIQSGVTNVLAASWQPN
jgi:hypothetical protein